MYYFISPTLDAIIAKAEVVIFDMNGLLLDDEEIQFKATKAVLSKYKVNITAECWKRTCVGLHATEFMPQLLQQNNVELDDARFTALLANRTYQYEMLMGRNIEKYVNKGAKEIIHALKERCNKKISLATSNSMSEVYIALGYNGLNLLHMFDFVVSGDDV